MLLLIILIVLAVLAFGGGFFGGDRYRTGGIGLGTILVILLIVLFITGVIDFDDDNVAGVLLY